MIMDKALQARFEAGNPVKVGMIGAGFMGRGPIKLSNRCRGWNWWRSQSELDGAKRAYAEAGIEDVHVVKTVLSLKMPLPAACRPMMPCCCVKQTALMH